MLLPSSASMAFHDIVPRTRLNVEKSSWHQSHLFYNEFLCGDCIIWCKHRRIHKSKFSIDKSFFQNKGIFKNPKLVIYSFKGLVSLVPTSYDVIALMSRLPQCKSYVLRASGQILHWFVPIFALIKDQLSDCEEDKNWMRRKGVCYMGEDGKIYKFGGKT